MIKIDRVMLSNTSYIESCANSLLKKECWKELYFIENNISNRNASIFPEFSRMVYDGSSGAIFDRKFYKRFD